MTKIFYKNGQRKTDREKVLEKAAECTDEILEAKKNYILKMSKKLEDSHTAPKAYWTILNRLIYDKIPSTKCSVLLKLFYKEYSVEICYTYFNN